jgi:hypothetical protein
MEDHFRHFCDDIIGDLIDPVPDGVDVADVYTGLTYGAVFPDAVDKEPFGYFSRYTAGAEGPELCDQRGKGQDREIAILVCLQYGLIGFILFQCFDAADAFDTLVRGRSDKDP